jgi:arylformamidase
VTDASRPWIDVTLPLRPDTPTWPGDPPIRFEPHASVDRDGAAVHRLHLGTHSGTHVDAPSHLVPGGAPVDRLPLDALCGPARLVVPAGDPLEPAALSGIPRVERLLFRTRTPAGPRCLSPAAAAWLAGHGVRLVGWDRPSVDPEGSPDLPAHRRLLAAGVVIVEALDLGELEPGAYDVVALPLRLAGLDGAPARVLVRRA